MVNFAGKFLDIFLFIANSISHGMYKFVNFLFSSGNTYIYVRLVCE